MVKRGRRPQGTLSNLVARLEKLDAERHTVVAAIRAATDALVAGELPRISGTLTGPGRRKGGRRKGFKLSAEARARIAAAQRKRWAAKRKAEAE